MGKNKPETQRAYYAAHKNKFREYKKRYAEKHAGEIKQRTHETYLRHREKAVKREREKRVAANPRILLWREKRAFFKEYPWALATYHRQTKIIAWEVFKSVVPRLLEGPCDICGAKERMRIDHCHAKNIYRGLLCHRCNMALGVFKDDPALLRAAATYLERDLNN